MIRFASWQPAREQLPPPTAMLVAAASDSAIGRSAGHCDARTLSGKTKG